MLALIATGQATWTVYHEPKAELLAGQAGGIAFRPIAELTTATALARPAGEATPLVRDLLAACRRSGPAPGGPGQET
jgi:hypothetical protein